MHWGVGHSYFIFNTKPEATQVKRLIQLHFTRQKVGGGDSVHVTPIQVRQVFDRRSCSTNSSMKQQWQQVWELLPGFLLLLHLLPWRPLLLCFVNRFRDTMHHFLPMMENPAEGDHSKCSSWSPNLTKITAFPFLLSDLKTIAKVSRLLSIFNQSTALIICVVIFYFLLSF